MVFTQSLYGFGRMKSYLGTGETLHKYSTLGVWPGFEDFRLTILNKLFRIIALDDVTMGDTSNELALINHLAVLFGTRNTDYVMCCSLLPSL